MPLVHSQQFTETLKGRLTVHFDSNSATISDSDKVVISKFVNSLNVVLPYVFRIQAHTDSVGSDSYNKRLSDRRAEAMRRYLLSIGIPDILISKKGVGEMRPIEDNSTEEGRLMNRRANIFVFEIQKQRLFKSKVTLEGASSNKAMVYVYSGSKIDSTESDKQGNFAFIVPEDKDVTYGVFAKGYMFATRQINTNHDLPIESIALQKITPGAKVSLQNLYFVGDQAVLLPESRPELANLLRFVRMNPKLKLEIGGHVNGPGSYKGDEKWYYNLADERAKTIKKFLVDQGFSGDNYRAVSYSNTQMVIPNPQTESEAKMNRRVEIKVDN
jgi:outer membrane protein OmpA-like peptidoglycan-associated protein